ncbi:MAG: hypothetical protein OIF50_13680 [Flavobacteriaceae bacterium]|nr:hypothetical protein [Flavobacteriaceae bacterium]
MSKFQELRIHKDFGQIIDVYFDFLRQHIKPFSNMFIRYNGIFLVLGILGIYFLVTGFMGSIETNTNFFNLFLDDNFNPFFGILILTYFIVMLCVGIVNYSLSTCYMITYENQKKPNVDSSTVWAMIKDSFGKILLFVLALILIYVAMFAVSIIFSQLQIIGLIPQYLTQFFVTAWVGISFFVMLQEKKSIGISLGDGWSFVSKNFWLVIGATFVMSLLIFLLLFVVNIIPAIILGVYTYHLSSSADLETFSIIDKLFYTIMLALMFISFIYSQCLTQFVNGLLYYSLHEKEHQQHTQKTIEQIGNTDA